MKWHAFFGFWQLWIHEKNEIFLNHCKKLPYLLSKFPQLWNQEQRTKTYLKSSANKAKSKGFFANFLVTCTKGQKRPKSFMFKEPLMLSIGCLRKDWQENGLRSLRRCKKRKLHNSWSSLWPSKAVKAGAASATQRTREFTSRPLEAFFARV